MRYAILIFSEPLTRRLCLKTSTEIVRKHEATRNELTRSGELLTGAGLAYPETQPYRDKEGKR